MAQRNVQRWDEVWASSGLAGTEPVTDQDTGPLSWEATINAALARMLEGDDAVERAIAARLLLAESYLGRLYRGGAEELVFAPGADEQ